MKSASGFIKRQLARTINLRNTPEIIFVMDQSIEYGVKMSHRIDEVIADQERAHDRENQKEEHEGEPDREPNE